MEPLAQLVRQNKQIVNKVIIPGYKVVINKFIEVQDKFIYFSAIQSEQLSHKRLGLAKLHLYLTRVRCSHYSLFTIQKKKS